MLARVDIAAQSLRWNLHSFVLYAEQEQLRLDYLHVVLAAF